MKKSSPLTFLVFSVETSDSMPLTVASPESCRDDKKNRYSRYSSRPLLIWELERLPWNWGGVIRKITVTLYRAESGRKKSLLTTQRNSDLVAGVTISGEDV